MHAIKLCIAWGVVEWLIKHEAKPSVISSTRPLLECHKSHN